MRRRAGNPRTYHFNRIVAADLFYLDFKGTRIAVLNVLDHVSGFQVCEAVDPDGVQTASHVWNSFDGPGFAISDHQKCC